MPKRDDWIGEGIRHARTGLSLVNDQAANRLKRQLETVLGERQLNRTELEEIARQLITDMTITGMSETGKGK